MYLIEALIDMFRAKPRKQRLYDPMLEPETPEDECTEHIFMPLDSDGENLACRNCGFVIQLDNEVERDL